MDETLIDINDLARGLKIPLKTIRNKLSNKTWPLPPVRIGRALRWRPSDVARGLAVLAKKSRPSAKSVSKDRRELE
jgi:predicted DNA-binding transcriptional regulator AlpA